MISQLSRDVSFTRTIILNLIMNSKVFANFLHKHQRLLKQKWWNTKKKGKRRKEKVFETEKFCSRTDQVSDGWLEWPKVVFPARQKKEKFKSWRSDKQFFFRKYSLHSHAAMHQYERLKRAS